MDKATLTEIIRKVSEGDSSVEEAVHKLRNFPSETIEDACIDHQRALRTGLPEVIYGESKTVRQICTILKAMLAGSGPVIITRVDHEKASVIIEEFPMLTYHRDARMITHRPADVGREEVRGTILVVCAGTSDLPVAEEAFLTAESLGHPVTKIYDAGVAGLHRLLNHQELLHDASVIVVVAGMEGALPSVVAGLVSCPVIAVPTSVGYGASFGGIAALLGMLNSCSPGIGVVNIDNGFGAACLADAINRNR